MTIVHFIVTVLAIFIAAHIIPGVLLEPFTSLLLLAVVLGVINMFFKPIIHLLTLPLNILTLGIFSLVMNALLVLLADIIVPGFDVHGFWNAFLFSIVVSLVTAFFGLLIKRSV